MCFFSERRENATYTNIQHQCVVCSRAAGQVHVRACACLCVWNKVGDQPVMGEPHKGLLACRYTQPKACRLSPSPRRVSQCLPLNYPSFLSQQGPSQITVHCPQPIGLSSRGSTFQSVAHCGQRAELGGREGPAQTHAYTQDFECASAYTHIS